MKFTTSLLTLLAASSVYSLDIFKRQTSELGVSPECEKELNTTKEYNCVSFNINNYEDREGNCELFESETCQKFYENPRKFLPICQKEPEMQTIFTKASVEFYKSRFNLACSKDGKGNWCPAGTNVYNGKNIDEKAVADTCSSKKCTVALNELLSIITEKTEQLVKEGMSINNSVGVFDILKAELNSPECSSKAVNDLNEGNNGKASSDASAVTRMGSSILLTLGLILAYF